MIRRRPHIAILGAGPVGLDAALAAREAGYPFTIYEADEGVGGHVRRWSHVRLFTSWRDNISPRMSGALEEADWFAPDPDAYPTGGEVVTSLLERIAALPGIRENLRLGIRVVAVSRRGLNKSDAIGSPLRSRPPFRILLETPTGRQLVEEAEVVLDCTGTYSNPNSLGDGGIPAPGERTAEDRIVREIPDFERTAGEWRGKRILLVGDGHSAQTVARELAALVSGDGETSVVWAVRPEEPDWGAVDDDPLPGREELTRLSRKLASRAPRRMEVRTGVVVDSIDPSNGSVRVKLRPRFEGSGEGGSEVEADRIVSLTGSVGDHTLYRQLQVHECYATSGPMKLAAALLGSGSTDCLDQTSHGPDSLVNPEPRFFLLGAKSYGRNNTFLMRIGWNQVDDVFELLERESG
ncbi:MAG: FAD-dependent oxidoreductase [Gemmatimonadota bacterium]